jgi:(p)ppGpp synthase/HD superfamily hydrolase
MGATYPREPRLSSVHRGYQPTCIYEAISYAFSLHGHDKRKSSQVPYMVHLLSMCALVIQDSGDEDEALFKPDRR